MRSIRDNFRVEAAEAGSMRDGLMERPGIGGAGEVRPKANDVAEPERARPIEEVTGGVLWPLFAIAGLVSDPARFRL